MIFENIAKNKNLFRNTVNDFKISNKEYFFEYNKEFSRLQHIFIPNPKQISQLSSKFPQAKLKFFIRNCFIVSS